MSWDLIVSWIFTGIIYGVIMMVAATGETLTEKAGHLNLGVPGIMYVSGFVGFIVAFRLENVNASGFFLVALPILCALLTGGLLGTLYSFVCVTLKANQNVMGLVLASFGVGFGKFLCRACNITDAKIARTSEIYRAAIPGISDIPYVGKLLFGYGFVVILAFALAILCHFFISKTRLGLNLRAVGESPATADAAGINVTKYRYVFTIVGCALCGLAGFVYVSVATEGTWSTNNNIETFGWLALALVIFSTWKPVHLTWSSVLFGFLYWTYNYVPTLLGWSFRGLPELVQMLPYLVTIIVLVINSSKKKRENQPPASLGTSYYREER